MRVRFAGLLAVAACNQVFGNNNVDHLPVDVVPGIDAAFGTMKLTWMNEPSPLAAPTFDPISGARVQVGSLTDLTDLQDRTIDGNGNFTVPYEILQLSPRYRLVYTPADTIPVEIQTTFNTAHFVVPQIGRLDRTPWPNQTLPAGGHVDLTFSGGPATYTHLRLFGTGLWSQLDIGMTPATFVNYSSYQSDSGPLGLPMTAPGDQLIFTDNANVTSSVTGYAYMTFDGFDGTAMNKPSNAQVSAWKTTGTSKNLVFSTNQAFQPGYSQRISMAWGTDGGAATDDVIWGGVIASKDLPPFTDQPINTAGIIPNTVAGEAETPVFAAMAKNTSSLNQPFLDPFTGAAGEPPAFPTAVYRFGSLVHTFTDVPLVSVRAAVQVIALNDGTAATVFDQGIGIANSITLTPTGDPGNAKQIGTTSDGTVVPRKPTLELTFGIDSTIPEDAPNDCLVTLYRIASPLLVPVQRYLVTTLPTPALPILIDGKNIDSTSDYTFGISCYRGHKNAAIGDWTTIEFPFAVSRIWTHSFKVQ